MKKFVFIYHGGGAPETPEEGEKVMAAWNAWYGGMGDALVDGGAPVGVSMTVTKAGVAQGGGANPVSGYTVVQAADMEAATTLAQGCPILDMADASVEVAEAIEM